MPIPFLVGLALAAVGGFGIKKCVDASNDNEAAQDYYDRAEEVFDEAQSRLTRARKETRETLDDLGQLKLEIWNQQFSRYVKLMEQIRHVELQASIEDGQFSAINVSRHELAEMKQTSLKAGEILGAGTAALGAGALAGVACYGGAMTFASASTGTAIASLSGVAATNATMAWFGGGSLAAGGLGVAGGTAVLGGVVAAPVLAVAGMVMASKAKEKLANARKNYSQAKVAAEQMESATTKVRAINSVAEEFDYLLREVDERMTITQNRLQTILDEINHSYLQRSLWQKIIAFFRNDKEPDYQRFDETQKHAVHQAYLCAQITKRLLETPILTKAGDLSDDYMLALEEGEKLLAIS